MRPRMGVRSAFRGFPFYYGAALGEILCDEPEAAALGLQCAADLRAMFSARLGLIPLGPGAEEGAAVGNSISSIDSLQASALLFWAYAKSGEAEFLRAARQHTRQVLAMHQRDEGSIVQSSELDPHSGAVVRHFTHKGYRDDSVWGRAQAWGLLYAAIAAERDEDKADWIAAASGAARWWIDHLPADGIAPWDFDDPSPDPPPDTAATAIASVGLLKLAAISPDRGLAALCASTAEKSIACMVQQHLTPLTPDDHRPSGMLIDACFNNRADSRPQDAVAFAEFIVGSFYLLQALRLKLIPARSDGRVPVTPIPS